MLKAMRESEWQTWVVEERKTEMDNNGKIDYQRLPLPETIARSNERGSGDDLLSALTNVWEEVLHVSNIGIDDDFFELGGHSLPAIILVSLIEEQLKKEISITDAVKNPTIRKMAALLESTSGNGTKTVASS